MTANYWADSLIGVRESEGRERREPSALETLTPDKMLQMGVVELLVTMAMRALNVVVGVFTFSWFFSAVKASIPPPEGRPPCW